MPDTDVEIGKLQVFAEGVVDKLATSEKAIEREIGDRKEDIREVKEMILEERGKRELAEARLALLERKHERVDVRGGLISAGIALGTSIVVALIAWAKYIHPH